MAISIYKDMTRKGIEKDLIKRIKGIQENLKIINMFTFHGFSQFQRFFFDSFDIALKEGNVQKANMCFAALNYVTYLYIKENNIAKPYQKKLRKQAIDALAVPDSVYSDKHNQLIKLVGHRIDEYIKIHKNDPFKKI